MTPQTLVWIYMCLLIAGGLAGFIKAKSRMSLITSASFAVALGLCQLGVVRPYWITYFLLGTLLVFFVLRFAKGKKFMPAGLMSVITFLVLSLLLWMHFRGGSQL